MFPSQVRFIPCKVTGEHALTHDYSLCVLGKWLDLGLSPDWPNQMIEMTEGPEGDSILHVPIFSGDVPEEGVYGVHNYGPIFVRNDKWNALRKLLGEHRKLYRCWSLLFSSQ